MRGRYNSVHALNTQALNLIRRNELNHALALIRDFVALIITEPLCTSHVFGSRILDELCQRIGQVNLSEMAPIHSSTTTDKPIFVYIVTKLQRSGGHTRVLEDFIKTRHGGQHVVLSTEMDGRSDLKYFNEVLAKQANVVLERSPNGDYREKLTWLQARLMALAPTKTYLFNHHQDSIAIAAVQPEMNLDGAFYHHGDHHLCLGIFLEHLQHIDPHPMGYHNCRSVLGIENIYVPLTADDKGGRASTTAFFRNGGQLTTCTAARSNKVEIPYHASYCDLVPQILKATDGQHIHIGRLTLLALLRIRRELKRQGIQSKRFIYIPWVPSVWKALLEHRVDLYIASFPYGGGLTLIEAMGAGIPVALHKHIFSRVLSGIDLAYPGAFNWRYPEELLSYCASITANNLAAASKAARAQFEQFHTSAHLDLYLNTREYCLLANPLTAEFSIEADEWALWMERQLNAHRLISRFAYRVIRRVRALWG